MIAIALAALAAVFAIAAFGVMMARWVTGLPKLPSGAAQKKPRSPYEWVWWRKFDGWRLEFRLANGETWRGPIDWRRYPDGKSDLDLPLSLNLSERFRGYQQQIEWNTDEAKAKQFVPHAVFEREHQTQLALLEQARIAQNAAYASADPEALRNASELAQARVTYHLGPSYTCPGCQFSRVPNPGQICARCLRAQGSP